MLLLRSQFMYASRSNASRFYIVMIGEEHDLALQKPGWHLSKSMLLLEELHVPQRARNKSHSHTIGARPAELGVHVIISQDHGKDVDLASEGEQEGSGPYCRFHWKQPIEFKKMRNQAMTKREKIRKQRKSALLYTLL